MLNFYNAKNGNNSGASAPPANANSKKPADFLKYKDPTGEFSSVELKRALWLTKHKAALYKILIGAAISIDVILIGVGVFKWSVYIAGFQSAALLENQLASSVNYTGIHPRYAPKPLQASSAQAFYSSPGKKDLTAQLININDRFLAKFDFYFLADGKKTETQSGFLLPGEIRPAALIGYEGSAAEPQFVIENVRWQRISAHEVQDTGPWQKERLNFEVSNFSFIKSLAQEGNNASALQFDLKNGSPFNYKEPRFYVAMLQNNGLVGILPLGFDAFNSLETKKVDIRIVSPLNVSEIVVYPLINIYDSSSYLAPSS